eukprot:TRINITY_DN3633_c0_g1_i4.p1 TRINITY_DN3633_c0_g1~~TRINITY_DN3633_c0_g1_i4.p1  ORF type:complete len:184 (-),score=33.84 TRINITY_DN3633_c0_g1_i4:328-879(-)
MKGYNASFTSNRHVATHEPNISNDLRRVPVGRNLANDINAGQSSSAEDWWSISGGRTSPNSSVNKPKSLVDKIQQDFPRTPSPVIKTIKRPTTPGSNPSNFVDSVSNTVNQNEPDLIEHPQPQLLSPMYYPELTRQLANFSLNDSPQNDHGHNFYAQRKNSSETSFNLAPSHSGGISEATKAF